MTSSIARAWAFGFGILILAHGAWFAMLQIGRFSKTLLVLLWCSPGVAAFVAAYLAPRKKFLLGVSMSVPAAVLIGVFNSLYEAVGHAVDFPGLRGSSTLVMITLAGNVVLCTLGGAMGYFLTRNSAVEGLGGE